MEEMLHRLQTFYWNGQPRNPDFRVESLKKLQIALKRREDDLLRAVAADMSKPAEEAYMTEIGIVYSELRDALRHLRRWSRARLTLPSIAQLPGHGRVLRDPYGVVLILSPWNYPIQLTLVPLIAAVASGNCAVVRPSSSAPKTAQVLASIVSESFREEHVSIMLGDTSAAKTLTALPFDKIFFTGSPGVGREVMQAASANLVPVTLELGGKSPVLVSSDADIKLAARRIVWGKCINAGQTCVAPDYVLAHRSVENALLEALRSEITRQYGDDPVHNEDLTAIISNRHFDRLSGMLGEGRLICGGQTDAKTRKIAPTVLSNVPEDAPLMQDEIFGPILPVLSFSTMEEALARVRNRPKPLALYYFTSDKDAARRVMRDMTFGGGCTNDCVLHLANARLPFGGVGNSGMGSYHGKYGFACFTREKGVFAASTRMDVPVRYAPWKGKLKLLRKVMK